MGEHLGISGDAAVDRVTSIVTRAPEAFDAASNDVARDAGLSVEFDWRAALSSLRNASAWE